MNRAKNFLINYCYRHGRFTQAVSMPFAADRYDAQTNELFIPKSEIKEFYKSLPPQYNNPKEEFHLREEDDYLILQPKEVLTKIVTVTSNLYVAVIINENNPIIVPPDLMTTPIYRQGEEVFFPVYIEAQPVKKVIIDDITYMGYNIQLNGVDIYADNVGCISLTNPIYTVENFGLSEETFLVRILENGKNFSDPVARHTILKTKHTKITLIKVFSGISMEKAGYKFQQP